MNSPTIIALLGFIGWSLFLLVLMESIRSKMVLTKEVAQTGSVQNSVSFLYH